ncbi:MAG: phosphoribosylformylglycinamidine synthase [Clostridia bacterium]|nr:phosphoribosylformylglycinamidine synthase [Clostridia bacterium]
MVYRVYVEKRPEMAGEAKALLRDCQEFLQIQSLTGLRIVNRYDLENITPELFDIAVRQVLSEPQLDMVSEDVDPKGGILFAAEYLPGQFDQRADSAAQCIQLISQGARPLVRTARVYILEGEITENELSQIKHYVINPVESREASLEKPDTLNMHFETPSDVETLHGFTSLDRQALEQFVRTYALAMDADDIQFCQEYFRSEHRDPTITEIRMIDTYWSDHCRHTTFLTHIDTVSFEDPLLEKTWQEYLRVRRDLAREDRPICLMDLGTIAAKYLRKQGLLEKLDESEEINACTVKMDVTVDGRKEPWLLLFKNETHNHPTEIEPFGGAATCIGGAIRDPLSGRAYVYGAMRVTGAADPLKPVSETIPGKLPQRKIVTTAAQGYSSYGNQIGLATGVVDEIYHPGYAAKRMEIGAVIAAAPAENVRRERPTPGDVVILLGGSTGRDGCGGATGSSKSHTVQSLETCGAEVQKGNAPEERKLQRLFRNPEATRLIKRCNDFGAGGVSVAIGELADGLSIALDKVPKKYEGLDGTELAISESQERMAVVVAPEDTDAFLKLAARENLQACQVATVQENPRLQMHWKGKTIVDLSREFLNSNGAEKHISIPCAAPALQEDAVDGSFRELLTALASDLNVCSKRGLSERFDSTIGAGSVLMPFGGKHQLTPVQAMVQKVSVEKGHTDDCTLMAFGYDPLLASASPYHGAYQAVVESVSRLIATGASFEDVYLTFQEYFPHPGHDGKRWSQPLAALLGAFQAQIDLGIAAIGGKDSMSGTFEDLDVPPTLVSFAVTSAKTGDILPNPFRQSGHRVYLLKAAETVDHLPEKESLKQLYSRVHTAMQQGQILSAWVPGMGGVAEGVMKMAFGNGIGFRFEDTTDRDTIFLPQRGTFLVEVSDAFVPEGGDMLLGSTQDTAEIACQDSHVSLAELQSTWEDKLEPVYPCNIPQAEDEKAAFDLHAATSWPAPAVRHSAPRVLIPAFPGTNCEYDSARAVREAGAEPEIFVVRNLTSEDVSRSAEEFAEKLSASQMLFVPGGFSGGDEPDGSGKFITAFLRGALVKEQVEALLSRRDGLILGICNGFQALIKLGLVPYGRILDTDEHCPTLTFNTIGRHQSRLVRVQVQSNLSPWLSMTQPGEIYTVPISHGEGRFTGEEELVRSLFEKGQVATRYVDLSGHPTQDVRFNPNDSLHAIEGITSPDGRVFGRMGHAERCVKGLYKNVDGLYDCHMFEAAVRYFNHSL